MKSLKNKQNINLKFSKNPKKYNLIKYQKKDKNKENNKKEIHEEEEKIFTNETTFPIQNKNRGILKTEKNLKKIFLTNLDPIKEEEKYSPEKIIKISEEINLNDSFSGIRAIKNKNNNYNYINNDQESILTDIKENLNTNYSNSPKNIFLKEDKDNENNLKLNNINNNDNENQEFLKKQIKLYFKEAIEFKLKANDFFKKNKFLEAINEYLNVIYLNYLY
jgi:hypothetical protein